MDPIQTFFGLNKVMSDLDLYFPPDTDLKGPGILITTTYSKKIFAINSSKSDVFDKLYITVFLFTFNIFPFEAYVKSL